MLPLAPGMRVLDLGCGHAVSSIFLARELGVTVWAVDRGVDPTDNYRRAEAWGCADRVLPLRADARALPLPLDYFDAVVSLDAYLYFGTDERFLPFLVRHLRPGGHLGIVEAATSTEIGSELDLAPELREQWRHDDWYLVHTIDWWRWHWAKTGLVEVTVAEWVPGSEAIKARYLDRYRHDPEEAATIAFWESSYGRTLGTFRMLAYRTDAPPHFELDAGGEPY